MKLETPFTGKLATLGVQARTGLTLRVDGNWELKKGAIVNHASNIGDRQYFPTCIGYLHELEVRENVLYGKGMGAAWLAAVLDEGTHALSMEMDLLTRRADQDIVAGRVAGALLVSVSAFAWTGVRS